MRQKVLRHFRAPGAVEMKKAASREAEAISTTLALLLKAKKLESNPPATKKIATINGPLFFFIFQKLY